MKWSYNHVHVEMEMKSSKKKYTLLYLTILCHWKSSQDVLTSFALAKKVMLLGREKNKGNLGKCSKLFLCTLKFMHLCTRNFVLFYHFLLCASSFSIFSTLNTQNNPIIILACSGEKGLRTSVLHQKARCMAPGLRFEHEPVSMWPKK